MATIVLKIFCFFAWWFGDDNRATSQPQISSPFGKILYRSSLYAATSVQRAHFVSRYCFLWRKRFKEGREGDPRCGRPSTSKNEANVELVKKIVRGDCRLTVRLISDKVGLNPNSVYFDQHGKKARFVGKQHTVASSRRCTRAHFITHSEVSGEKKNVTVLEQPFYSPGLTPCDFFLFPKVKNIFRGISFSSTNAIKNAVTKELRGIPQESFQKSIDARKSRIEKCVELIGDYFEGDNVLAFD